MSFLREFAPAKINLYLHVTGRREDGYHDLDSLVNFAGVGDELRLESADSFSFVIEGPQAQALSSEPIDSNLAVKALKNFAEIVGKELKVKVTLVKNLPVASGIGGGSSDAAAALRALAKFWGISTRDPRLVQAAEPLGQDVPVCLKIANNYMTAQGTADAPEFPYADIVMVNPNKGLPTAEVYKAYKNNAVRFSPIAQIAEVPKDLNGFIQALEARWNDLCEPACKIMPEIKGVLDALQKTDGCMLARMSGSGATCFGIYSDRNVARKAAADLLKQHPEWWVTQSYIPCRVDPRQA